MNLFLKPDELKFLALAIVSLIEDMKEGEADVSIPWNPEARKIQKEMKAAGESLRVKLRKLGLNVDDRDPYRPGDENEFLTKES